MQAVAQPVLRQRRFISQWIWLGLALLPVVYYYVVLGWFAYDMPYMDDYPALVDFLNRLPGASAMERWRLLLEQNNFHRVVWVKAVAWFGYALTGRVSFTVLQYAGNVSLLLATGLLLSAARPSVRDAGNEWLALPVLFLLFQFQSWNNAFWAMAAMSNLWAPAWALLAFWLASHRREGPALLVGVVALLTNGNGILVLPLLLAGFVFAQSGRWAVATLVLLVPAYGLYFSDYQNPSGVSLTSLLSPATFAHWLTLDTAFLGAMFYHPAVAWLPSVVGWATIGWTLYLLVNRYDRTNPTLFWMLIFLQLTGLMLATNRISNPVEAVFASRYKNITALLTVVTYLTVADVLARSRSRALRPFAGLALAGSVVICVISNWTYHTKIVRFRELKQTDQLLWQRYGIIRGCSPAYGPVGRLNQLARAGIFRVNPLTMNELASQEINLPQPTPIPNALTYRIDLLKRDGDFLVVSGFVKITGQKANFNDTYLAVQTPTGWRFFTTLFHQRLDNDDSLNDKDTGFTAIVPTSTAGPSARLGLWVRSGGKTVFQML